MRMDDRLRDGEPKTKTACSIKRTGRITPIKRLKDSLLFRIRYAGTVVPNLEANKCLVGQGNTDGNQRPVLKTIFD